jgi:hypothetical protein
MVEWRCFHCDEVFTDKAEAQEHFGLERDASTPACQLTVSEVRELRALEQVNAELRAENEQLENLARLWHEAEADRQRRIGHRQWWQEIDSREGEKLVLLERIKALENGFAVRALNAAALWTPAGMCELADIIEKEPHFAMCEAQYLRAVASRIEALK